MIGRRFAGHARYATKRLQHGARWASAPAIAGDIEMRQLELSSQHGRSSNSSIRATVFGSTGFLGNYVVDRLGRMGSQIVVPRRRTPQDSRDLKMMGDLGKVLPIQFNIRDLESVRNCIDGSDIVINTIGLHTPPPRAPDKALNLVRWLLPLSDPKQRPCPFYNDNVNISEVIAMVAKECGVKKFIQVSALGADANSPSLCLSTKAEGEATIREYHPDATILRPAPMFGPEDTFTNEKAWAMTRMRADLFNPPPPFGGAPRVQPVSVHDVADAVEYVVRNPVSTAGETYELAGGSTHTLRDIYRLIRSHLTGGDMWSLKYTFLPFKPTISKMMDRPLDPALASAGRVVPAMNYEETEMWRQHTKDRVLTGSPGVKTFADMGLTPTGIKDARTQDLGIYITMGYQNIVPDNEYAFRAYTRQQFGDVRLHKSGFGNPEGVRPVPMDVKQAMKEEARQQATEY